MSDISASSDELQAVSSQFNSNIAELEHLLQQLQRQVESLSFMWEGSAASDFTKLKETFATKTQEIHVVLNEVKGHLIRAGSIYNEVDQSVARGFMP